MGKQVTPNWLNMALLLSPYYTLCLSKEAFHKELKKCGVLRESWPLFVNERADATTHFLERQGRLCAIVCVTPDRCVDQVELYAILIHEAVHIWQQLCLDIHESAPGEEVEAYAIQHLAEELIREYLRQTEGA